MLTYFEDKELKMEKETVATKKIYDGSDDKTLLLVKGANGSKDENKSYVKELAVAISTVYQKHGIVRLRCIGKGAIGNAAYAHAIAHGELAKQEVDLRGVWTYQTVSFADGVERTALVCELNDSVNTEE